MNKFVFVDRDGVINEYPGDGNYVVKKEDFHIIPGAAAAIAKLKSAGFKIFVISNQACVSKGLIKKEDLMNMTAAFLSYFDQQKAFIDGVYYCIHTQEEACSFRKPSPKMVFEIYRQNNIKPQENKILSYFIGDSIIDIKTARAAGCRSVLVLSGREKKEREPYWEEKPDYISDSLLTAADLIIDSNTKDV
ncbi:MAG: HAD-IIIA family hydrolase [Candidatus Omnitrophica bacterium]|nr:HAD-IIIA family hydrolase [Candidatus Omnitrophota bacterium]